MVQKKYICYVIFEESAVDVLPHWASCPTLPYAVCIYTPMGQETMGGL